MSGRKSGNALILLEIWIAILVFSIAATACVQVFIRANAYSEQGKDLSHAVIAAQNIAECYKANGGNIDRTAESFRTKASGHRFGLYYDANWDIVKFTAVYSAEIVSKSNINGAAMAQITLYHGANVIYTLEVAADSLV